MIKFLWGFLAGAFLGAIVTMWYIKGQLQSTDSTLAYEPVSNEIPVDFLNFYEKFHGDSIYQMNHIVFPLQGLPAYADSITMAERSFKFQKEDWVMHRKFNDQDGSFERKFNNLGAGMMVEQIQNAESGIGIQRRFAKRGAEWFLIYYAQVNFIGSN